MAVPHCVPALESYLANLRSRYDMRKEEDGCFLETPFYLPDNTRLGVHLVERSNGTFEISDYGETFDGLFTRGVTIAPVDKRLVTIGQRFGVEIAGGEISKTSNLAALNDAIDAVVHAMLDMAYLVYTRRSRAVSNFEAEFEHFLIRNERNYDKRVEVIGQTDTHIFDFRLSGRHAPKLIETLSTTSREGSWEQARLTSFKVFDTKQVTRNDFEFVCLVDDRTGDYQDVMTEQTLRTLREYLDSVVLWSEQSKVEELLAA
ncbi:MAG: DUF1828 domain-containing protein [Chloroflexota bacterium]|nr:DUF1828 domain-containing protein [Chloroflexota bacterium]